MIAKTDRAALAESIERRDNLERDLKAAKEGESRAFEIILAAQARLEAARAAEAEAEDGQVALIIAGEVGALVRSQREIRSSAEGAAADIEAAKAVRAKARLAIAELERALDWAERRVGEAIGRVMAGRVGKFVAEVEALAAELAAKRAVLAFIYSRMPRDAPEYGRLNELTRSERFVAPNLNHAAVAPWRAAHEALLRDADAALPEG